MFTNGDTTASQVTNAVKQYQLALESGDADVIDNAEPILLERSETGWHSLCKLV